MPREWPDPRLPDQPPPRWERVVIGALLAITVVMTIGGAMIGLAGLITG